MLSKIMHMLTCGALLLLWLPAVGADADFSPAGSADEVGQADDYPKSNYSSRRLFSISPTCSCGDRWADFRDPCQECTCTQSGKRSDAHCTKNRKCCGRRCSPGSRVKRLLPGGGGGASGKERHSGHPGRCTECFCPMSGRPERGVACQPSSGCTSADIYDPNECSYDYFYDYYFCDA
eukprot:TRINITY_DN2443_c0_g1_i5.p1 TRINITY_DN2443_c0_g1~~TRINITY_DN2443_c0_g1_i5.p1  ORF type:complete len:178 (+),score=27.87 TRINITY_DN2443_c0_g1_i5:45-578(+)